MVDPNRIFLVGYVAEAHSLSGRSLQMIGRSLSFVCVTVCVYRPTTGIQVTA